MNRTKRAHFAIEALRTVIPAPETELDYCDPYQLLVAVILSAQCTDERVNSVTPAFFAAYPNPAALAGAEPEHVLPLIRSISYPNNKSKHLVGTARAVMNEHGGSIPETVEGLMKLPGVGRKTAQVVASVAFDVPAFPVDTHVFRVVNRIGITRRASTPHDVEKQVKRLLPPKTWGEAHHLFILHGRYTCTARNPRCNECPATAGCLYFERRRKLPADRADLMPRNGRFFCGSCDRYFDDSRRREDRHGIEQHACPSCRSMNVFNTRTGRSLKAVLDFRV